MNPVSARFFIFLICAFVCYFAAPGKARPYVLLAASYIFYYLAGGIASVAAVAAVTAVIYCAALCAERLRERKKSAALRRVPVVAGLAVSFGLLCLVKYGGALFTGVLTVAGISFYAFQVSGYLIDVYRGKIAAERNVFKLALFTSFFPQLMMGPVARYSQTADALFSGAGWDFDRARSGVQRIIWGCFLKIIVADNAAALVDAVFSDHGSYGGAVSFIASAVYFVQLYADFSGGISVAAGVGEIVGVSLPENFRQPVFSRSLTDYWRRWHITLCQWLRDYLFYPVAFSKPLVKLGKLSRRLFGAHAGKILAPSAATFAVYLAVGLWHGSSLKYTAFGLLNGGIITLSLLCEPLTARLRKATRIDGDGRFKAFAIARTLVIVILLQYFTRADRFITAYGMLLGTFRNPAFSQLVDGTLLSIGMSAQSLILFVTGTAAIIVHDAVAESGVSPLRALDSAKPAVQIAVYFCAFALLALFGVYREGYVPSEFIYGNL